MQPFIRLTGVVAPLDRANVDTDAIIPKQYLKSIRRSGFGANLFDDWRYLDPGEPDQDYGARRLDPDFVLNKPAYRAAQILLTRKNFGCGSSREHAVWALLDAGFRAVIAPSFADIFFNNSLINGLLPVVLADAAVDRLFAAVVTADGYKLTVDLEAQTVMAPDGECLSFNIDASRKYCLLRGLDDIDLTLTRAEEIRRYEARRRVEAPWLF